MWANPESSACSNCKMPHPFMPRLTWFSLLSDTSTQCTSVLYTSKLEIVALSLPTCIKKTNALIKHVLACSLRSIQQSQKLTKQTKQKNNVKTTQNTDGRKSASPMCTTCTCLTWGHHRGDSAAEVITLVTQRLRKGWKGWKLRKIFDDVHRTCVFVVTEVN